MHSLLKEELVYPSLYFKNNGVLSIVNSWHDFLESNKMNSHTIQDINLDLFLDIFTNKQLLCPGNSIFLVKCTIFTRESIWTPQLILTLGFTFPVMQIARKLQSLSYLFYFHLPFSMSIDSYN